MPKCVKLFDEVFTIVDTITEENFATYKKLEDFSCTKFSLGDIIAADIEDTGCYELFTKDLKFKNQRRSRYSEGKLTRIENKIYYVRKEKKQYPFLIISKETLVFARFIFNHSKPKIGEYVVDHDLYSQVEFLEKFKIVD